MSAPVLEARVRLPLDRFALDVDLSIAGGVTGIFGPSGSGKTSLLESIAGLRRPATARIVFGGETWEDGSSRTRLPPERRRVGYVPQDSILFPHLDVRGNLLAAADRDGDTFEAVVSVLALAPLLERGVLALSGGEKQRVALGRALCARPRLLLLDEPLSAVDLAMRGRLLAFLRRIRERFDVPMLLVSHDPLAVQALADDVIVLQEGKVRARGAPREVLTDPSIFPLAEAEGFRNVLPCRVDGPDAVRLGARGGGPRLHTAPIPDGGSEDALVTVPAADVLLATEPPRGLSARNAIPATIRSIVAVGRMRLVHCRVDGEVPDVVAEVTEGARAELGLEPGRVVHLVVKAAACAVLRG
jgi:molybdate transport system ATP-binding protein